MIIPQNRHEVVDIVDDENLCFTSMLPVKPTDILGQRALPRNGHRQEQRVQSWVIKALADVTPCREDEPFLIVCHSQGGI